MKIHQIRNATIVCEMGPYRILVDPMLGHKAEHPPLRIFGLRQRNPLVELPVSAEALLQTVTHCLITHCQKGHFDHLDRPATEWLKARQIPVICTPHDARYLARRGLNVQPLAEDHWHPQPFLGGTISTVSCTHGRGLIGHFMEHGVGYFIQVPGEPGLYLSGDTVLTEAVRQFVRQHQPEVSVVPAGGACMDIGGEIIMGVEEVIEFTRLSSGRVIANHLEALSHCPVSREALEAAAQDAGLEARLLIPADGAVLTLAQTPVQDLQTA
ncbi:MBL fold metallo-hydrolase [Pseudomonas frederiksbergensis]|uniref:Zn-dependent hydrolase n=1 Tax=Pseudomonas frederiksbergensis TaxID=104087 RepID=A0A423HP23_9PSED|nr:MBL fold metallo-hydrolase [Pseudomonas frederiksbergensis]RON14949.1 Zn-dependent hydrolase [Pseudomonas frederiksbergensis]